MPTIHYVCPDGLTRTVNVRSGLTIMEAAAKEGISGMLAECGGAAACATCHVYVDESFLAKVGAAQGFECDMLDEAAAERRPNSRLACQINVSDDIDGIVVEIAAEQ